LIHRQRLNAPGAVGRMHPLQKSRQIRSELLDDVSHELRTLLTLTSAHLETLSLKKDLSAHERREYLHTALVKSRRVGKLVAQLLDLYRLEAGSAAFAPEPLQLAELAQEVIQKAEPAASRAGVKLRIERLRPVPLVLGDVRLLLQAFENLLDNAVRYAGSGGEVVVRVLVQKLAVRVEVYDSGPVIAGSDQVRVLERFCRSHNSRSDSGHSGVALAIVRGILQLHGQEIAFLTSPSRGTTFSFALPLLEARERHGARGSHRFARLGSGS